MEDIIVGTFKQYGIDIYKSIAIGALVFARLIGIIFQTPFLGGRLVPGQVKVGISVILMMVFYPYVFSLIDELPMGFIPLVFLWMKEVFVGFAIGFIASLIFFGIQIGGRIVDMMRGENMVNIFDPYSRIQASPTGELLFQLMIVLWLTFNGHHIFIKGIAKSFEVIPINGFVTVKVGQISQFVELLLRLSADIFLIGVLISAPAIIVLFLIDASFGIINRVAPQIQVFFLAMPLKALIGVLMVFLALHLIANQMEVYLHKMLNNVHDGIELLGK